MSALATITKVEAPQQVLSRYIALRHRLAPDFLRGRTVLELGSGTGLVGIVAAMLEPSADVWITDQQCVVTPLLDEVMLIGQDSFWA